MRSLRRGIALGIGVSLGRALYSLLSVFLGLVVLVGVGMVILNHWILAVGVVSVGFVVHDGLLRLLVRDAE